MLATVAGLPSLAAAYEPAPLCAYPSREPAPALELLSVPRTAPRLMCEPVAQAPEPRPPVERRLDVTDARRSLARARELAQRGQPARAVLHLRSVAQVHPELADLIAFEEAEYRMAAGADEHACEAYERAARSPHRTVAARARIGHARCLLAIGDRDGAEELTLLERRYPDLPHREELQLLLAAAHEGWGEPVEAGRIYRRIDQLNPGSPVAGEARERLARLREGGAEIRELNLVQRVERAERLVRSGPMDLAREEIAALQQTELPQNLARQVARSAARIARVEGRWEDASRLLREAQGLPDLEPEEQEAMAERIQDLDRASESRAHEDMIRRIRGMTRGRRLSGLPTARLFAILRMAARAQIPDVANDVLAELRDHNRLPPGLRFDAAILAAGTADDEHIEALFAGAARHPNFEVAARYHRARALERLGRDADARAEYAAVLESDSTRLPYYAMWARQRLRSMETTLSPRPLLASATVACDLRGPFTPVPAEMSGKTGQRATMPRTRAVSSMPSLPANPYDEASSEEGREVSAPPDPLAEADETATRTELDSPAPRDVSMTPEGMAELLGPLAEEHGDAFPWLRRALSLIRLGELDAAGDEIHETYTAWRDASGQGSLRAGFEGVLRGSAPPRHRVSGETWRARRTFPVEARRTLARLSAALGDHGLAIRFSSGFGVAGPRPRAYEDLVEAAAARHGVEPELLFAVMRVESVYNPRIISYAGAIGLMQIMPRTGRNIAHRLGRDDFTVDQLLEPEVNIELAAWYLASLIERFHGRVPLAVASYNGGPHNVRRWMRDHSPDMPLDAFLEIIPFEQTHRYVRRVMTHYEAYLAQRHEALPTQDVHLPELEADQVAF